MPHFNSENKLISNKKSPQRRAVKTPEEILKHTHTPAKEDIPEKQNSGAQKRKAKKKSSAGKYIGRVFISLGVMLVLLVFVAFSLVSTVANGPSPTLRDQLVLMAMQASATKWVPGLFLPEETVNKIVADSKITTTETISINDYQQSNIVFGESSKNINFNVDNKAEITSEDPWKNAVDGMIFQTLSGKTFKAYVLLVKDPSRVYVGTSSDYKSQKSGMDIFNIAKKYNAVAAINGGEFSDPGGVGDGGAPIGITYSQGQLMWTDKHTNRTFIGIDKNDKLVVSEGMNKATAESLGIRDGVCFQTGNVLITNDGSNVTLHRADGNTGTAQRTAIGQTADGTIILLVTDGRTSSSLGATHNDVIDIMVSYGAVTAGMLDGGSSAMMYYDNYFEKYEYDFEKLDPYQKRGLVNKYKAFTDPRLIPTYFIVGGEG